MTGLQRKLTAILSADVKGYSRLMSEDDNRHYPYLDGLSRSNRE